jgi:hypothetical protein
MLIIQLITVHLFLTNSSGNRECKYVDITYISVVYEIILRHGNLQIYDTVNEFHYHHKIVLVVGMGTCFSCFTDSHVFL